MSQNDHFLIGIEGQKLIRKNLSAGDLRKAISDFQQKYGQLPTQNMSPAATLPVFELTDLLGVQRNNLYSGLLFFMRDAFIRQLDSLPSQSTQDKEKILEMVFPYIGLEELRPVVCTVLEKLEKIPNKFLKQLKNKPDLFESLPIKVKRQVWEIDNELFRKHVFALLHEYLDEPETAAPIDLIDDKPIDPKKRRENNRVLIDLKKDIGISSTLYNNILHFCRILFINSNNPSFGSFRNEILMSFHDDQMEEVYKQDPCHYFSWWLDAWIRYSSSMQLKSLASPLLSATSNAMTTNQTNSGNTSPAMNSGTISQYQQALFAKLNIPSKASSLKKKKEMTTLSAPSASSTTLNATSTTNSGLHLTSINTQVSDEEEMSRRIRELRNYLESLASGDSVWGDIALVTVDEKICNSFLRQILSILERHPELYPSSQQLELQQKQLEEKSSKKTRGKVQQDASETSTNSIIGSVPRAPESLVQLALHPPKNLENELFMDEETNQKKNIVRISLNKKRNTKQDEEAVQNEQDQIIKLLLRLYVAAQNAQKINKKEMPLELPFIPEFLQNSFLPYMQSLIHSTLSEEELQNASLQEEEETHSLHFLLVENASCRKLLLLFLLRLLQQRDLQRFKFLFNYLFLQKKDESNFILMVAQEETHFLFSLLNECGRFVTKDLIDWSTRTQLKMKAAIAATTPTTTSTTSIATATTPLKTAENYFDTKSTAAATTTSNLESSPSTSHQHNEETNMIIEMDYVIRHQIIEKLCLPLVTNAQLANEIPPKNLDLIHSQIVQFLITYLPIAKKCQPVFAIYKTSSILQNLDQQQEEVFKGDKFYAPLGLDYVHSIMTQLVNKNATTTTTTMMQQEEISEQVLSKHIELAIMIRDIQQRAKQLNLQKQQMKKPASPLLNPFDSQIPPSTPMYSVSPTTNTTISATTPTTTTTNKYHPYAGTSTTRKAKADRWNFLFEHVGMSKESVGSSGDLQAQATQQMEYEE